VRNVQIQKKFLLSVLFLFTFQDVFASGLNLISEQKDYSNYYYSIRCSNIPKNATSDSDIDVSGKHFYAVLTPSEQTFSPGRDSACSVGDDGTGDYDFSKVVCTAFGLAGFRNAKLVVDLPSMTALYSRYTYPTGELISTEQVVCEGDLLYKRFK
jgi:hypothetical protein